MTDLEERHFSKKHVTSIQSGDEAAEIVLEVLSKGISKGDYYDGSRPSWYSYSLDRVYSSFSRD
jgi:hypothetical protein